MSNARELSKLVVGGEVSAGGVDDYADVNALPGNPSLGDLAFITGTNTLYVYNGSAWFNIAIANQAPTAISGNLASYELAIDGTPTVVTLVSNDPEGFPLTWSATTSGDTQVGTVTNVDNVFTITPSTDQLNVGTLSVTFSVTDGNNTETSVSSFTLAFLSPLWDETVLSVGTSSTDGLNNTTYIDKTTNSSTLTGTAQQSSFHPYLDNYSVEFDGNDYLNVGSPVIPASGDFTVEFWYMSSNLLHRNDIISQYTQSTDGRLAISQSSSSAGVSFFNSRSGSVVTTTIPKVGEWNHFAYVRDGDTFRVFVNGVQEATGTGSGTIDTATNTFIGVTPTQNYTEGYISDVRISSIARYDANGYVVPTEKLTADADTVLLTCQSNRFIDKSTNNHTITVNGTPRVSAFQPYALEEYTPGQNKGSGYNGYVINNSGTILDTGGTGNFTYETWVYARNGLSVQKNVFKIGSEQSGRLVFEWNSGNGYRIKGDLYGVTYYTWGASSTNVKVGEWQHFAIVRNNNFIRIYVNGIDSGESWNLSENVGNNGGFVFGSSDTTFYMADSRLTLGTAIYTSNFTPPTSPIGVGSSDAYVTYDNPGIYDKKGNNTINLFGDTATSTALTKFADTAMYFDGSDYIEVPWYGREALRTSDFTIESWIYIVSSSDSYGRIIESGAYNTNDTWRINYNNTASSLIFQIGNSSTRPSITTTTSLQGAWHHIAVCRDVNTIRFFVDGTQEGGDLSYSGSLVAPTNTNSILLGTGVTSEADSSKANYFNGYMENLQILKGVAKYTTNFTPPNRTQGITYQAES